MHTHLYLHLGTWLSPTSSTAAALVGCPCDDTALGTPGTGHRAVGASGLPAVGALALFVLIRASIGAGATSGTGAAGDHFELW
jgi:hypothetical protein